MSTRSGQYSKNIFDPFKRTWGALFQEGVAGTPIPLVDADWNDSVEALIEGIKRYRYEVFGDGTPGTTHWEIIPANAPASTTNNFEIDGGTAGVETAARIYVGGLTAVKPGLAAGADVQYDPDELVAAGYLVADYQDYIYRPSTNMTNTVLTDIDANWIVNELVLRELVPDVTTAELPNPALRYTITSNTATTITVNAVEVGGLGGGVGMLADGANIQDYYCIKLSTPNAGAGETNPRVDGVYLDVYLDEWDSTEDADLLHGNAPGIEACRRLKVSQQIQVLQDEDVHGTYPLTYVSAAGNQHYRLRLGTITRADADAIVSLADIVDDRPYTQGYGSSTEVINARASTVYGTAYLSLDARLEFMEDDAHDAQQHMDEARSDGTISGGVCTDDGAGGINYTAWVGYVAGEKIDIAGGNVAFPGAGAWYVSVDNAGAATANAAVPANEAALCRFTAIAIGPAIVDIWDFRLFIDVLDSKLDIVVEDTAGGIRGNMNDLQSAIDYAVLNGYGTIRVRGENTAYVTTAAIAITTVDGTNPTNLRLVFDPSAQIQPAGGFNAFDISNCTNLTIEGLNIDGTNMGAAETGLNIDTCTNVSIVNYVCDAAGFGIKLDTVNVLKLDNFYIDGCQASGIIEVGGALNNFVITNGYIDAVDHGIQIGTLATASNWLVSGVEFGTAITDYALAIGLVATTFTARNCVFGASNSFGVINFGGPLQKAEQCTIAAATCTIAGVLLGGASTDATMSSCSVSSITGAPAVLISGDRASVLNSTISQAGIAQYPIELTTADQVVISGCRILGAVADGIYADDSDNLVISDCYVTACDDELIRLEECDDFKVTGCTLTDWVIPGRAITVLGCLGGSIMGNSIDQTHAGAAFGIRFDSTGGGTASERVQVVNNTIDLLDNQIGIYLGSTATETHHNIEGNTIEFAASTGSHGIQLARVTDLRIVNNSIDTALEGIDGSVAAVDTDRLTIIGNHLRSCARGIWLDRPADDSIISNNVIYSTTVLHGIFLDNNGDSRINIANNEIYNPTNDGIHIVGGGGSNKNISGNSVYSSGSAGIWVSDIDDSRIIGNYCFNPTTNGLYFAGTCSRLTIASNVITSPATNGMWFVQIQYCAITGNSVYSTGLIGMGIAQGAYNSFTGNIVHWSGGIGMSFDNHDSSSINGNTVTNGAGVGINLTATCDRNAVAGNLAYLNVGQDINNPGGAARENGIGILGVAGFNTCDSFNSGTTIVG